MPDESLIRRYYEKRTIVDFSTFTLSGEICYLLCLTDDQVKIIRAFMRNEALWNTTYQTEMIDNERYYCADKVQFDYVDKIVGDILNQTRKDYQMACFDDLIAAINSLGVTIQNGMANSNNCGCSGSGNAGIFPAEPEPFTDDGGNFPDGYADRTDYLNSKCNLAEMVRQRYIDDNQRLRQIEVAGKTAGFLAVILTPTFLTPIPLDDILGIVGLILGLVAISLEAYVAAIDECIAYWENFDICLWYNADNATEATEETEANIDNQVFTFDTLTKAFLKDLVGPDALNILFAPKSDTINYNTLPTGDCSECDLNTCEAFDYFLFQGTPTITPDGDECTIVLQSTNSGQSYHYASMWLPDGNNCCFEVISLTKSSGDANTSQGLYCNGSGWSAPPGSDANWIVNGTCNRSVSWLADGFANVPFTLTMRIKLCSTPT